MKSIKINKNLIFITLFVLFCAVIFAISLRGNPGSPQVDDLPLKEWKENGPLELSPERGRFALLYSFVEDNSLEFSIPLARFSVPDIAVTSTGQYVSLFMPGVSFLVIPGYYLGKYFGASQVGTFAMISLFAIFNMLLVRAIVIRLGGNKIAAVLAGFTFIFATPAFAYAVSLYQHHISTFIILLAIYILLRWKNFWSLGIIWFLCAASLVVDNPNVFLMLPIGLYALGQIIILEKDKLRYRFKLKPLLMITLITMLLPIGFFLWFNKASYGNPFQLPGTMVSVGAIDENGQPTEVDMGKILTGSAREEAKNEKTALGFFQTRNMLNGFYTHLVSPDRGVLWFTPVMFLGIFGLIFLYRKNSVAANLFVIIIGINFLLYSMWGDPYGGWAFGSRYLIPTYALLSIGLGIALSQWKKNLWLTAIFSLLFLYSAGVNTLGALTSSVNPPKVQVLELEKLSGQVQKYTYARNWQYLSEKGSKAFIFRGWAKNWMDAEQYYIVVYALVAAAGVSLMAALTKPDKKYNIK